MKPFSLIGIWITGILGAAVLGALTNFANSQVSALYFRNIMHWRDVSNISQAIVAQGFFEGILSGLLVSTIFATIVGIISSARCPYKYGVRYVGGLILMAFVCWIIGGLLAVSLASLSPEFYRHTFIAVPEALNDRLRYAWVGGSIWGIQFGGIAAMFIFIGLFRAAWTGHIESAPNT
jgi:hypothetical protein